jgi:hypothetical protein
LAVRLRLSGASYEDIARQLDYAGRGGAYAAVTRELKRRLYEPAEELRTLELERLDRAQVAVWKVIVQHACPVNCPQEHVHEMEPDPRDVVNAVSAYLRISKRRAELLGLDAPKKIDISAAIRQMAVDNGLDPEAALRDAQQVIDTLAF